MINTLHPVFSDVMVLRIAQIPRYEDWALSNPGAPEVPCRNKVAEIYDELFPEFAHYPETDEEWNHYEEFQSQVAQVWERVRGMTVLDMIAAEL